MAAANRYGIYPSQFTHAGGTLDLTDVRNVSIDPGANRSVIIPGGLLDASMITVIGASPIVRLSTQDLSTALTDVSLTAGLAITGATKFQFQSREDGAGFEAGANHYVVSATLGFLLPERLAAQQDDEDGAVLDLAFTALYDGTNLPLIGAASQSLALSPALTARYHLGPAYYNSVQVPGVTGVTINFGIDYSAIRTDGDTYPTKGAIVARRPTVQITSLAAESADVNNLFYGALAGTLACYFAKGSNSGTREAYGGAANNHIKISMGTGDWHRSDQTVDGNGDTVVTYTATPTTTLAQSLATDIP